MDREGWREREREKRKGERAKKIESRRIVRR
jgi:hypothetical protein